MAKKASILKFAMIFAIFLGSVILAGYSWSCHCTNPNANGGCGGGCTFKGVTCGPGEIQWCSPRGPCMPLSQSGACYDLCKHLLTTGGKCVCGNYVYPLTPQTTTTTIQYTTSTTVQTCSCNDWFQGVCGANGCAAGTRNWFRSCFPSGCDREDKCVSDPTCGAGPTTTTTGCGADLLNDDKNCGYCGHICPEGFPCTNGMCQQTFVPTSCKESTIFYDSFETGLPNGWQFSESGGDVAFSDNTDFLKLESNGNAAEFPLVGRSDIFYGIGNQYYIEVRFQYPKVSARAPGISIGSASTFSTSERVPAGSSSPDRENVLSILSSTDPTGGSYMAINGFGEQAYNGTADNSWHTVRIEYVKGEYKLYLDGTMYLAGYSQVAPASISIGNNSQYQDYGDWGTIRVDYVKVGTLCQANGCSADVSNDDRNCGFCGHICPTGFQCQQGMCQGTLPQQTTTTVVNTSCQTPAQWGTKETCCDNADNDNNGLIDAADPACSKDTYYGYGINNACYASPHQYANRLQISSGYFSCPSGADKMRLYLRATSESSDKLSVYDGNNQNSLIGVIAANFNGGQYGWTDYYLTSKIKLGFNSDPTASNYGFDVAKVDCFDSNITYWNNFSCDSYYCSLKNGNYCNGPNMETRSYFCSQGLCQYSVTSSQQSSGSCGAYGMTLQTDKYQYNPGEEVKISGSVDNLACPTTTARDTFVEVRTDFGRWTTYTDYSGNYYLSLFSVPTGMHEINVRAFSSPTGAVQAYSSAWIDKEPNSLKVTVLASPITVLAGETSTISGRVTSKGAPVGGADVEVRAPWATYHLTTDSFGGYSVDTWTTSWYGNSNITVYAQTGEESGTGSAILNVNPSGQGNEIFTLSSPQIVKPNSIFYANGSWFVGGIGQSEPIIVTFKDTRKSVSPVAGYYNVSLPAPSTDGCWMVSARNLSSQTCVRTHSSIMVAVTYSTGNLEFDGTYEDGSPVSGSLSYAIDSGHYIYQRMDNGVIAKSLELSAGSHTVWANINDGTLYNRTIKQIDISASGPETTTTEQASGGTETTYVPASTTETPSTIAQTSSKVTAAVASKVGVCTGEKGTLTISLSNKGTAERAAQITVGSAVNTVQLPAGSSQDVKMSFDAASDEKLHVEVVSLGETVLRKDVDVSVRSYAVTWPSSVFYKGDVVIPYEISCEATGVLVNESLTKSPNATIVYSSSATADLPLSGNMTTRLDLGTYSACVSATRAGTELVSDCQDVVVKQAGGISPWFIAAIGGAAILLLLF